MELKAAVIGVGYLGRFHAQKYAMLDNIDLVGVVDSDADRAQEVAAELDTTAYTSHLDLLDQVDLVSIAVPTNRHFNVAEDCLKNGVHVLLEKPMTQTIEEADILIKEAEAGKLVLQVGHLERFNAAILAVGNLITNPTFLESQRLAPFKPRGTDVNVVLDLMIHDIDIILSMVPGEVVSVEAVGSPVLTEEVDIANARLVFTNGCVANVTASRVSREPVRKIRVFQADSYFSIDYQDRHITILQRGGSGRSIPEIPDITLHEESFGQGDPLLEQINSFIQTVKKGGKPIVSGEDGRKALEVANLITQKLDHST